MSFFNTMKELSRLAVRSKKIWLIPIFLLLIIVALVVVGAQISPVPIFLYPII